MKTTRAARAGLGCILLAALGPLSTVAATSQAETRPTRVLAAAKDSPLPGKGGEVVYHWRKVVSAEARVDERLLVSTVVKDMESRGLRLDLEQLIDSEGRSYQVKADAHQESEGGPVTYEMKLVRYTPRVLDEAGIERAWKQAHPKATARELEAFRARRAPPRQAPSTATELTADLRDWLSRASQGDELEVVVKLQETESPLRLPKTASHLFNTDPVFALGQVEARLLALEARKNELEALQAPLARDIQRGGGRVLGHYWVLNGLRARVTRDGLARLAADPRVRRVERFGPLTPDTNNLDDMRTASQVVQFHTAGHEGGRGSWRGALDGIFNIYLAIIDTTIDVDHPAWKDASTGSSRLTGVWREQAGVWSTVTTSATGDSHGTKVAGVAMGDLTQGQDPAITTVSGRDDRTGFAPEASFAFIEIAAGTIDSIQKAIDLNVDIINLSVTTGGYTCDRSHSTNDAADEAMLDGIFFSEASGSNAHPSPFCNVGNPTAASGVFTVAAIDLAAVPLNTGLVRGSHGPDDAGRAVVAMAAAAGPEGTTAAGWDDTYGIFGGTSASAPVVAGSAAVLKDHLLSIFSASLVNEVGYLYATMLLMGDGQTDNGVAGINQGLDSKWGVGRLRMRMFDGDGMDSPWHMGLSSRTLSDGEVASVELNTDASNINQPLPNDVDRIRATVFWHEPNIEDHPTFWATIRSSLCNEDPCVGLIGNSVDQRRRHRVDTGAGGKKWRLDLVAVDVPASWDSNYHHHLPERKVYVSTYWEDGDRDDADGPDSSIQ